ncbi:hypothetical protein [Prevotella jejuni]|uniref:hypothetical protein n=1 Tax=Prevotella jejuni TaxID=1177574 RepID=UPI003211B036
MRNFTEVSLLVCICPRDKCVSFQFQSMKLIVSIHGTQGFNTWNAGFQYMERRVSIHGTQSFNTWNAEFHPMERIVSGFETHSLKPMKHRVSSM